MPNMASSGGSSSPSNTKFIELLDFFETKIEHMESKIRELEADLNNDERKEIEKFKMEVVKVEKEKNGCFTELKMAMEKLRDLQTENQELLDEVKSKNAEVEDYRQKYLETLQKCEEQSYEVANIRTQLNRLTDASGASTNEMRLERLQRELAQLQPLPMELKAKTIELTEAQSAMKIRDNTIDALARDLEHCLTNSDKLLVDIETERAANKNLLTEINNLKGRLEEKEEQLKDLTLQRETTQRQNSKIIELEECLEKNRALTLQFEAQLSLLKEESVKQITRVKERGEAQRGALNAQIGGLERELAHARAALKAAVKERDDTRSRMKMEVLQLEGKFNEAQLEIRNLRSNIDLLKTSYSHVLYQYDSHEGLEDRPSSSSR